MKSDKIIKTTLLNLSVNFTYAVCNCIIGFYIHSWWFITMGAYYMVLSTMRFAVLQINRTSVKDTTVDFFAKRFTGIMFIILSICLVGTVVLSVTGDRGVKFHEITMITIALYTFTKVVIGIVNLVKSRKTDSPTIKTLRNISFADAFVSVFSLQRSMLVSFPGMAKDDIRLFNLLTGSAVCILVFLLGINLIGGRKVKMAKSKIVNTNKKIAETVVDGYKKIEKGVVDGYKKIEQGVTDGYTKIEDKFVDAYLTKDGETVEEAKARLHQEKNK